MIPTKQIGQMFRPRVRATILAVILSGSVLHAERILVPGLTQPILDATLGTPVEGIVATRKFKEGDFVKSGEVIIALDKHLEEIEVARRAVALEPLKADYEAAKFLFAQPKSSVSKEVLDKKEMDYNVAVKEHQMALELLRRRSIQAPFDGYVSEFFLEVGEAAQIEHPLARLVDTRRCYFVGNVDAKKGQALELGQKVQLEIEAGATPVQIEGTISFLSPVVDPASGLLKVKAIFDNTDGKIRPGVAGKLSFEEPASGR